MMDGLRNARSVVDEGWLCLCSDWLSIDRRACVTHYYPDWWFSHSMVLASSCHAHSGAIERDVLACLNRHPRLRSYGQDFKATGLTNMSMESVNVNGLARQHVVMEMLVVSSKPRELFIRVSASHHPEEDGGQGEGRWEYESVEARTPDGNVVDLTQDVTRGGRKIVVIDVDPREVREGD